MVKVLVIPAFAILTLLAWRFRRDSRLMAPMALKVVAPLAAPSSDGLVVAWRRAGVI